mgnify:CR=1 FL=1
MKKILLSVLLALGCCASAASPVLAASEPSAVSESLSLEDGGKATVQSPTLLTVTDGVAYASITWSSTNYDYMIVDGQKYLNESGEGSNSHFTIPVPDLTTDLPIIADTLAMGTPHEVKYTLTFDPSSIDSKSSLPQEGAKRVLIMAAIIIIGGGILNHFVNERRKMDYTGKQKTR